MDKERMAELEKIEAHGAKNGWVAPMAEEDRGVVPCKCSRKIPKNLLN